MLKMKLPMRTAGEGGDDTAEDELEQPELHIPRSVSPSVPDRFEDSPRQGIHPSQLDKETVFEWFGLHLNSAKRVEFMCGLLHMCQPLELRFLGSCLEDLARKDYHVLRDFENRANTPNDLGILSDAIDPVVRSKLLVCLSLLGSDSRECAGILFRILSHVDPASFYKNYGYSSFRNPHHNLVHPPCADGDIYGRSEQNRMDAAAGPLEQLALLFTMASLHPAFPFHQRETIRMQLDKIEHAMAEDRKQNQHRINAQQLQVTHKPEYLPPGVVEGSPGEPRHSGQNPPSRRTQRETVHIERIVLKGISGKNSCKIDREYNFEVTWSNSSSSKVTKTHLELENFLLKLPKEQSAEWFEKSLLCLLSHADVHETREVERTLREKLLSAPQSFRQTRKVCSFFRLDSNLLCSKCSHIVLGKAYKEDCSEVSSQEEDFEPYLQGQRKKLGSKSPSLGAKGPQGESRRAGHGAELNGQPEWRRRSCSLKASQEHGDLGPEQDGERRNCKNRPRPQAPDRETEGRAAYLTNGGIALPLPRRGRESRDGGVGSGQDPYGSMSSESYSSPSSPLRDGRESLDSEDEKNKDTDSHSDDSSKGGPDGSFFPHQQEVIVGSGASTHPLSSGCTKPGLEALARDPSPQFPPLSFMHPMPYMLPNGAVHPEAPHPVPPPPDAKASGGSLMPVALVPSAMPLPGDPEKRVSPAVLPAFGAPSLGLHGPGSPGLQALVQRAKTAAPQTSSEGMSAVAHQPPVGAISVIAPGQAYGSPLQPAYPSPDPGPLSPALPSSSVPLVDPGHAKHPGLALPSGLPSPYTLPHIPASALPSLGAAGVGLAPSPGQLQTLQSAVPPSIPTHTPGPAPSPSPALTHSTAQSDSTSYINSTTCGSAGGGGSAHSAVVSQQQPVLQAQATPPQPQQPMGCGSCGCRGNCGGAAGNATGHASFFFPPQMAPRQMFGVPPLFQLTSLCSNSYLTTPAQTNGGAQLPFFPPPSAPPPPYPPGGALLHTHAHSDHVLGGQATGYGLQQMPPFSQRFYQHVYPSALGLVAGAGGGLGGAGVNKKNGNVSCYNCGVSGHYAQDCKQPSIDSSQQGGFRLKYPTSHASEALDNAD
ncbi:zinc finger CCHC domain-containing protein 2 isoform X1 [Osmerus mordax]|uniref:zinc finger CCHC domain-containing protein 2 isoform X1 n=1 Tax=Osmerus mordax TaxID=8014 RepID=UPI0035103E2A